VAKVDIDLSLSSTRFRVLQTAKTDAEQTSSGLTSDNFLVSKLCAKYILHVVTHLQTSFNPCTHQARSEKLKPPKIHKLGAARSANKPPDWLSGSAPLTSTSSSLHPRLAAWREGWVPPGAWPEAPAGQRQNLGPPRKIRRCRHASLPPPSWDGGRAWVSPGPQTGLGVRA